MCSAARTEYIIVDAGAQMNPCAVASLYTADTIYLVASPDVPSVRNAQRLLDRIGQLGASGDRVRVLLNRAAEPYPIPPSQIENALGHPIHQIFLSDYKTVSTALNSGVPLALAGNSELASQFDSFARRIIDPDAVDVPSADKRSPHAAWPSAPRVHLVTDDARRQFCLRRFRSGIRLVRLNAPHQPVRQQYLELRASVHRKLLNRLNLEALANADRSRAEGEIRTLLALLLSEESTPISLSERETLFAEVLDDVFGLGPLEPLLRDPAVSDILVNTYRHVFIERKGVLERVTATFQDDAHLLRVIDRIVSRVGRRVDDSSPMVDARLADGSRVNAIIPPLAVDGPLLSIRRFPAERLKAEDLVTLAALTQPMLDFLSQLRQGTPELPDQRRHRRW